MHLTLWEHKTRLQAREGVDTLSVVPYRPVTLFMQTILPAHPLN